MKHRYDGNTRGDDASGARFQIQPSGVNGPIEIEVAWGKPFAEGATGRTFFWILATAYLSASKARAVRDRFHGPISERDDWLRTGGFETALGLPAVEPVPQPRTTAEYEPVAAEELRRWGALQEIVEPASSKPPAPREVPPMPALTASQRRTLNLHLFFITKVWDDPEDLQLFNRYKRHLPAARRGEVDDLLYRITIAAYVDELRAVVARILEGTWQAEDWAAVIRDPKLLVRQSDAGQARWSKRLRRIDR